MTNTVTKINENTDENNSKELKEKEIRNLLNEIDDELVEIEESAEKSQKEVKEAVSKKVEELRGEVDKINKKWKWGRIKDILEEDIKSGLEELKKEIEELEKPLQVVPFNAENNPEYSLVLGNKNEKEQLEEWSKLFHGKSPMVVYNHVKGLEEYFMNTNSVNSSLRVRETKIIDKFDNLDVMKLSESITGSAETYMNLAKQVGDASGLGLFVTPAASAMAAAATVTHGVIVAGAVTGTAIYETTREGLKDYALETQSQVSDHIKHHADNAEKLAERVVENFDLFGAVKSLAGNMGEHIKETEKAREERRTRVAEAEAKARVERMEDLEKQLEELKRQLEELKQEREKQIRELKEERRIHVEKLEERIEKKDERIRILEEKIEKLEGKLEKNQDRLFAQVEEIAKSRSTSPVPPYSN